MDNSKTRAKSSPTLPLNGEEGDLMREHVGTQIPSQELVHPHLLGKVEEGDPMRDMRCSLGQARQQASRESFVARFGVAWSFAPFF